MWIQRLTHGVECVAFAPDGRTLFTIDRSRWLQKWDVQAHTAEKFSRVRAVDWGYVRRLRVAADGQFVVVSAGGNLFWPVNDKKDRRAVPEQYESYALHLDRTLPRLFRFNQRSRQLMSWDLDRRKPGPVFGPWDEVYAARGFDISPDGRGVCLIDLHANVVIFDLETGHELRRFAPPYRYTQPHDVRFSPDGRTLVVFADAGVQLWDVEEGSLRGSVVFGDRYLFAFHPTESAFASVNADRVLTLFSLQNAAPLRSLDFALGQDVLCVAFSPDGLTCAAGGSNKRFVVFDVDL